MLDDKWITIQIAEARKSIPNVTDVVVAHIEELLIGQFAERQLTSAELKNISITLLQEIIPNSPEMGEK
jgi:hypothetical protein